MNVTLASSTPGFKTAEVDAALRAIVPRVFSEAGASVSFPESGDPFEKTRLSLARAIVAVKSTHRY